MFILVLFLNLFDLNSVLVTSENNLVLIEVLETLRNLFNYVLFGLLTGIVLLLNLSFYYGFMWFINPTFFDVLISFSNQFLGIWFAFPDGTTPTLFSTPILIINELLGLSVELYLLIFFILFLLSMYFMIKAIFQSDPENNLKAIRYLVLMIIVPLIIFGFIDMLELFNLKDIVNALMIPLGINLDELTDPLSPLFNQIPINDVFSFFSSWVTLFAVLGYAYLEFAFQINYIDLVTNPSLRRSRRLEAQLSLLKKESGSITANVEKIKEEAEKKKEEMGLTEKEEITKFLRQKEEKLSYIKEMIERKKLETEEEKLIQAASKTRRLGRYVEKLIRQDPEAEEGLTASSSAPKTKSLIFSTVLDSAFRITILVILSFIIIHPELFLQFLPAAITESIAMQSPEVIILLLIPIILLFPIIAKTIGYIRQRSLIIQINQEEKVQEIYASVGDYVKKDEESEGAEAETTGEQPEVEVEEATP